MACAMTIAHCRRLGGPDPAAAQKPLSPLLARVKHASLPGRHAILALGEIDTDPRRLNEQRRRLQGPARADPCQDILTAPGQVLQGLIAKPIHVSKRDVARAQPLPRADHDLAALGIELHHLEGLGRRHADPAPLADGVIDDAAMPPEHAAVDMDDVARLCRARAQPLDDPGVAAGGHEADVLAV